MNKKFLSLLILGLAIHSLSFSSAIGDGSDNESTPSIHSSLAEALTGEEVDWSSVFATIGLNQRPQEMDAATVMTEMPHGEKTKKKKKRGNKSELPAVFNYLPEVDTASTQKELRDLQRKYVALRRPILDKPDKKRTTNDKKNLQALAEAFKYIEKRLNTLQKAQGQAKIEAREAGEAVLAEARKKAEEAKALLEKERQQKEKEKKEQEKEMLEGSRRTQDNGNEESKKLKFLENLLGEATGSNATMAKEISSAAKQYGLSIEEVCNGIPALLKDPIATHNGTLLEEFRGNDQVTLYEKDIDSFLWIFVRNLTETQAHACPVCGTINKTPCRVKYAFTSHKSKLAKDPQVIKEQKKLDEIVELAKNDTNSDQPIIIEEPSHKNSSVYNLFLALVNAAKENNEKIPMRSIGKMAMRFRTLVIINFEHVQDKKPTSDLVATDSLDEDLLVQTFEEKTALREQRYSLFTAAPPLENMMQEATLDKTSSIQDFYKKLTLFAQNLNDKESTDLINHLNSDNSEPIEVHWCPACFDYHQEKVKVEAQSQMIQFRDRQKSLLNLLKNDGQEKKITRSFAELINALAYPGWHHIE